MSGYGVFDLTVTLGDTRALDNVTLPVAAGSVAALVGGDGAGKTTLLRALVGQVVPTRGTVRAPARERIGYLPASAGSWGELSVDENVEFVGGAFGLHGKELARRADPLLEQAGLKQVGHRLASQLSGGMRKKLGFCLAMLHSPDVVVLDEPSTGVDPVSRVELWQMVAEAAAQGAAVVMATTYLDEAERAALLLVLEQGQTLVSGTAADALAAMPGTVTANDHPLRPEWAWRRGRRVHEWWPPDADPVGDSVSADLEDAVIVASLRRANRISADADGATP